VHTECLFHRRRHDAATNADSNTATNTYAASDANTHINTHAASAFIARGRGGYATCDRLPRATFKRFANRERAANAVLMEAVPPIRSAERRSSRV
jgi:hypothetical protein